MHTGNAWRLVQGEVQGQTHVASHRLQSSSDFAHSLDVHLCTAAIQGWPRLLVEVYAVNVLQQCWPVGYGFVHIPSTPGPHRLEINTWKIAPNGWWESIRERFGGGGAALSKTDLLFSGVERYGAAPAPGLIYNSNCSTFSSYKLQTRSSGKVIVELNLIFRKFNEYGVEFK